MYTVYALFSLDGVMYGGHSNIQGHVILCVYVIEYNTRVESAQREASRDPTKEHTTIASSTSNDSVEQLSNGEDC